MKIGRYTLIGFVLDVFDWIGIGMIPVVADIVDIGAAIFWTVKLKNPLGLVAGIELIPLVDILPTNIAIGYYADQKAKGKGLA